MKNKKILLISLAVILLAAGILGRRFFFNDTKTVSSSRTGIEMGTAVSVTLYKDKGLSTESKARAELDSIINDLFVKIDDLDRNVLSWRSDTSETARFNAFPENEPFAMSTELDQVVRQSLDLAARAGGAADITLRPLIALWGIEEANDAGSFVPPREEELRALSEFIGYRHLSVREGALIKDNSAVQLDLGAVGKGYALDAAYERLLLSRPVKGAIVSAGGSILAYGSKGAPWQIGIRDPEGAPTDYLGILSIPGQTGESTFVSTSGGYEKYAEYNGQIYEHILDGRTLRPVENELYSVTVLTHDSGLLSDGLSTACFILGAEDSMELLEHYHAEAVFVFRNRSILLSESLKDHFTLTDSAYSISGTPEENRTR